MKSPYRVTEDSALAKILFALTSLPTTLGAGLVAGLLGVAGLPFGLIWPLVALSVGSTILLTFVSPSAQRILVRSHTARWRSQSWIALGVNVVFAAVYACLIHGAWPLLSGVAQFAFGPLASSVVALAVALAGVVCASLRHTDIVPV